LGDIDAGTVTVTITGDDSDLKDKMEEARSDAEDLGDLQAEVPLTADDSDLKDKLEEARSELEDLRSKGSNTEITADSSGFTGAVSDAESSLGSLSDCLGFLKKAVEAAFAYEVVKEFTAAIQEAVAAAGQAQTISERAALKSGAATKAGIEANAIMYNEFIDDYAVKSGKTHEDIASSLGVLGGYGVRGAPSEEEFAPFKNLSTSTNSSLTDSTSLIMATQRQFGMTMADNGKIADMYARSLADSNLSISELNSNMSILGPLAKETGMPLETLLSTLTIGSQQGLDQGLVSNALRMGQMQLSGVDEVTQKLDKKTSQMKITGTPAAKALESLGLSASNVKNQPLLDTLAKMQEATKGMSQMEREGVFKDVFQRNAPIMSSLAEHIDQIKEYQNTLDNAKGTAQTFASTLSDNYENAVKRVSEATDSLKESVGEIFMPAETGMLDFFSTVGYDALKKIVDAIKTGDPAEVANAISSVIRQAVDYLEDMDYNDAGQAILKWLQGAWTFATTLFGNFLKSDTELTGAFSALKQLVSPTINSLFNGLESAALPALNAIGQAVYAVANAIGCVLSGAINTVIGEFASLAGAADNLSGGRISALLGLQYNGQKSPLTQSYDSSSSSGDGGEPSSNGGNGGTGDAGYLDQDALYTSSFGETKTGAEWSQVLAADQQASLAESGARPVGVAGVEDKWRTPSISRLRGKAAAQALYSGSDIGKIDATQLSGSINLSDFGIKTSIYDFSQGMSEEYAKRRAETQSSESGRQGLIPSFGLDNPWTIAYTLAGNSDAVRQTKDEALQKIEKIPESQRTESQKQIAEGIKSSDKIVNSIDKGFENLAKAGTTPDQTNYTGSPVEKYLKSLEVTWKDVKWTDLKASAEKQNQAATDATKAADKQEKAADALTEAAKAQAEAAKAAEHQKALQKQYDLENALQESKNLLSKTAEADLDSFCEAMSDFGMAQERATDLFQSSYIGPSSSYSGFLELEAARGSYHPEVAQTGFDYSQAQGELSALQNSISSPQKVPVSIDDSEAMSAIQAIDAAASAPQTKIVYVQEVGGGSYGGGSGSPGLPSSPWDTGAGAWDYFTDLSFADEGYVSGPTLAMVGDAPSGEYILHGDTVRRIAEGKGQSANIVNVNVTVNGDVHGDTLVEYITKEAEKRVAFIMNCEV
jgi:TP901 family phage tail tape measure protein